MKNKFVVVSAANLKLLVFVLLLCITMINCSSNDEKVLTEPKQEVGDPIENPIQDIGVENYPAATIDINHEAKTILLSFDNPARVNRLNLSFSLPKGVKIVDKPTNFDLLSEYTLKLSNNGNPQEYKMKAKAKEGDFDGWKAVTSFGDLPEHINLYENKSVQGRDGIAYIAVVDMSKPFSFDVLGEKTGVKTPSEFYDGIEGDKPTILINSGYFTYSASSGMYGVSLLVRDSKVLRHNTVSTDRQGQKYFMTRSAIGFEKDNFLEVNWVFTDGAYAATFAYSKPAPNVEGETPLVKPSKEFPEGGKVWKHKTAIGAGPIAAKYGKVIPFEEMKYELLTGDGNAQRPRAAVGLTSDNKMIFYVNQGNGFDNYYGYTWEEVGTELVKLGCYDVIHFDGGGSVCMLINGIPLIKGGEVHTAERPNVDGKIQRAVSTAVIVK